MQRRVPVETELGIIRGRDSIHLESLTQADCPVTVKIAGEIDTRLCSNYAGPPGTWVWFDLILEGVLAYAACSFDLYPGNLKKTSSIDRVEESDWARELGQDHATHFIVSTYDLIFDILAKECTLKLGAVRQ